MKSNSCFTTLNTCPLCHIIETQQVKSQDCEDTPTTNICPFCKDLQENFTGPESEREEKLLKHQVKNLSHMEIRYCPEIFNKMFNYFSEWIELLSSRLDELKDKFPGWGDSIDEDLSEVKRVLKDK